VSTPLPRDEFAVTQRYIYLNHAAVGVLPQSTVKAVETFARAHGGGGVLGTSGYEARMPEFRARIGSLVGAGADEIAIAPNTSAGANAVALGLDWHPGDEVILCDNEFPANAVPWLALRRRGVVVRMVETQERRLTADVLRRELSPRTKVVAVSWVSYADGYRHDLAALAETAHACGALLCVDAMQGLGVFPLDVRREGVDALYCGAAKWLLGLQGVAFLYVRSDLAAGLELAMPGWRSMLDMWDFVNYEQPYTPELSRFEGGTPNFLGALSLATSIEFLQRHDVRSAVASHVLALTDRLCEELQRAGARLSTLRGEGISSGIVTFSMPGCDSIALGRELQRHDIVTTYRASGIRIAPHGYNTFDEIDCLLNALSQYAPRVATKA
jgi:cysteine desulfurase / selenocysteine lyase